jgi:3'-phosphoadenosine 5'-phosphosulfate sulfotransferase (PAPS reductase)/FAD synthetase
LKELQALPLERKIQITQTRIIEWYQHYDGNVCVSFSGGKDSTVLLHIARHIYPNIPAAFSNTGLEYPEIQRFVKSFDNVDIVTPSMNFGEVISTYGYPLIGKEVAEAIYYARRIRPAEREREVWRKQRELLGQRQSASKGSCWATERLEETGTGGGGRRTTSSRRVQRETGGQFSAGDGKPG